MSDEGARPAVWRHVAFFGETPNNSESAALWMYSESFHSTERCFFVLRDGSAGCGHSTAQLALRLICLLGALFD